MTQRLPGLPSQNNPFDMEITVRKENGVTDLQDVYMFFRAAPDGGYALKVRRLRRTRTLPQNDYLWGVVYPALLDGLIDAGWEFTSTEQVHAFFKGLLTSEKVVNRHTGEVVELPGSTASMDTAEFSAYVDRLRDYAREYLGTDIPEPDTCRNTVRIKDTNNENLPNHITQTLLRTLPLILVYIDREAMFRSPRLHNAVRQVRIILKQLNKIEKEQNTNNKTIQQ
jgi:hypothetical protein